MGTIDLIWLVRRGGGGLGGVGQGGGQGGEMGTRDQQGVSIGLVWLVTGGVGGMGQGGGQGGGRWGGWAPESSVGATRRALVPPFWAPLKINNWSDLAGDEGGRRGGGGPGRRARGGRWGGAPESSVGATRRALVPPWRGGGGPGRWARRVDGGGYQRAVWEQQGVHWFRLLGSLKNRIIGQIWLVGGVGGVGQGGGQGGVDGGGALESSVGATRRSLVPFFGLPENLTIGLIWLVTGQGGGQGGVDGGGHQRAVWEQT